MYVDEFKDKWCLLADRLYTHLMILGLMDYLYLVAGKPTSNKNSAMYPGIVILE